MRPDFHIIGDGDADDVTSSVNVSMCSSEDMVASSRIDVCGVICGLGRPKALSTNLCLTEDFSASYVAIMGSFASFSRNRSACRMRSS